MTWIKKDQEILGYEIEKPNSRNVLETYHYHKSCYGEIPEECVQQDITGYITKEIIEEYKTHKLMCDLCGEEIEVISPEE